LEKRKLSFHEQGSGGKKMMKKLVFVAFASLLSVLSSGVFAALDLYPAPFRTVPLGIVPTTYQSWDFSTSTNPTGPDVSYNSYGEAEATIMGDFWDETFWYSTLTGYPGHQGIWGFEWEIQVNIPNSTTPNPYKQVWLQTTYTASNAPNIFILPEGNPGAYAFMDLVDNVALGDGWYHAVYSAIVMPNPSYELGIVRPADCTLYVDDLIIETICTPEPATLLLIGFGAAMLRKKR
jgi:hypothetical protein